MSSSSNVLLTAEGTRHTERAGTLFCLGDALEALRVRLLEGRLLRPGDYIGEAHIAVISEGLANRLWPGQDPIGRHVKFGAGIALGLCLSLVTARLLSSFLYDTSPLDPVTYILVTVVLTLVAVGAAAFPALRVIQTDPVTALRLE